jgi:hypothetical protein
MIDEKALFVKENGKERRIFISVSGKIRVTDAKGAEGH